MKAIYIPSRKCSISTNEVDAGRLLKTVLAFWVYLRDDRPSVLLTASTSLSGELLCMTVYSQRAVYTAVLLPGYLHVSCSTVATRLPKPPATFLHRLAELVE